MPLNDFVPTTIDHNFFANGRNGHKIFGLVDYIFFYLNE